MEKSKTVKGYIAYHKEVPYGIWSNEIWSPLQVNTENNGCITTYGGFYDNEGDNISIWNLPFGELTGLYWVWRNLPEDCEYVLFTQYRRRFDIQTEEQVKKIFENYKVVVADPARFKCSLKQQYAACHSPKDIETVEKIVKRLYPEYADDWDKYINRGGEIHYSNGMVFRKEDFCKYCEWLFSIESELLAEMKWNTPEDVKEYVTKEIEAGVRRNCDNKGTKNNALNYQSQIPVFLSERLLTLYVKHNFKPEEILKLPYYKMENCF